MRDHLMRWIGTRKPAPGKATGRGRAHRPALEDLEGRQLLTQGLQPFATLPPTTSNLISEPDGALWVATAPIPGTTGSFSIDRIGPGGSVMSFPVPASTPSGFSVI